MTLRVKKRPIESDAVKYDPKDVRQMREFAGKAFIEEDGKHYINTAEGKMECSEGCYVLKGVEGEFWPVKGSIFEKTYDVIDKPALEALTAEQRKNLKDSDFALPSERRFPIKDADHVEAAWRMMSLAKNLSKGQRATIRENILKRAKQLKIDTSGWEKASTESIVEAGAGITQCQMDVFSFILNQVSEEAGEAVQASCKAIRFGLFSVDPNTGISSIQRLAGEIADVVGAVYLLNNELHALDAPIVDWESCLQASIEKRRASLAESFKAGRFTLPADGE